MPELPPITDPNTAILMDRLDRLGRDFADHRQDVKQDRQDARDYRETQAEKLQELDEKTSSSLEQMKKQHQQDISALTAKIDTRLEPISAAFNKAAGGYLVIVAAGAFIAWGLGVWDKIGKFFTGGH